MRETLPVRKRLRIKYYDYSKENMYFITICVKDRLELLGTIKEKIKDIRYGKNHFMNT